MSELHSVKYLVTSTLKGITPKYVERSNVIVLNQKCIRNNKIDYSFAQYHDPRKIFSPNKIVRAGDILINSTGQGTAGRCAFVNSLPPDVTVISDSHILIVRVDDFYTAGCLEYALFGIESLLQTYVDGSTGQGEFDKQRLFNIFTGLPSARRRKPTYEFLNHIALKIDCNNRINAELEAMAKTLYDYWFVQFDFPDANGKPYKSSGGKMVYNAMLKQEIPLGWDVGPLSDWIATDKTGDWGKEAAEGNYTLCVDCIRGADINGLNGTGTVSPPTRFILEKNAAKVLSPFDFVIEISGGSPAQSTGRLALITEETIGRFSRPLICSNFCKAIALKDSSYFFNFAYLWKSAYDNNVLFGWEGKTSGIKNLLFDAFTTKHLVCRPPQKLARRFFEFVAPMEAKKQKQLQESEDLSALRDWLVPLLMNGQVTVA